MQSTLKSQWESMPHGPGVYLFKDRGGRILYVGKAGDLKKRVKSYLQPEERLPPKTRALMRRAKGLDWIAVDSEHEALILEADTIRREHPRYNVLLRDDKRFPWLRLSVQDAFPTLTVVRKRQRDGALYFGPYTSARAMRQTLQLIRLHCQLRKCRQPIEPGVRVSPDKGPCLYKEMGKCLAPCEGGLDPAVYGEVVEEIKEILAGRVRPLIERSSEEMRRCAEERRYEEAARYRDKMVALNRVAEKASTVTQSVKDEDLLGVALGEDEAVVVCLKVREGKLAWRDEMFLDCQTGAGEAEVLEAYLMQRYGEGSNIPSVVCLPEPVEDMEDLQEMLTFRAGRKVALTVPQIGDKKKLLGMASKNARLLLSQKTLLAEAEETPEETHWGERLGLDHAVRVVDAVDAANLGDSVLVAAVVRLEAGRPQSDAYRKFTIKEMKGRDDVAAVRQCVSRYLDLLEKEQRDPPDLLLIDGGEGHRRAAAEAVVRAGRDLPVVSLSKREETLHGPGKGRKERLDPTEPDGRFLMLARNEAHRFAQAHLHLLASKATRASLLDRIPGIGSARKKALLEAFGSVSGIRKASIEEIQSVPGIGKALAEQLKGHLG